LGNKYSEIVSASVTDLKYKKMNFSNNRINEKTAEKMISLIDISVQKIDLSRNKIGRSILKLEPHIIERQSK